MPNQLCIKSLGVFPAGKKKSGNFPFYGHLLASSGDFCAARLQISGERRRSQRCFIGSLQAASLEMCF